MKIIQRQRKYLRLPVHDYSQVGAYFVTMVTYQRSLLFEDSSLKECVQHAWTRLDARFPTVSLDMFVVMPNHLHGIVISGDKPFVGANVGTHELFLQGPLAHALAATPAARRQMLLPKGISYFKMNAAKQVNLLRGSPGAPVWQRSYYERIVRNAAEMTRIREYIQNNPAQWELDTENPTNWRHP